MTLVQQAATSIATARSLASAHPGALVPCPRCGALVRSDRFERHLEKVHPEHASIPVSDERLLRVRGRDGKMVLPAALLIGLWGLCVPVSGVVSWLVPLLAPLVLVGVGVSGLLAFLPFFAAMARLFPATLEVDGDVVRVRSLLGLRTKQVELPAELESGTLARQRGSAINRYDQRTEAHPIGTWLRLRGRRSLTVGTPNAAGLGKRWAEVGWSKAGKTGSADIEIDREGLLLLEYRLAALGMLHVKPG